MPFDIAFFVAQRRREIRLAEKATLESGSMTIESHMKFDSYRAQVQRLVLLARENQSAFWAELSNASPSLLRLDEIGASIQKHMSEANLLFERMLRLNPNSVSAIRMYSQFLGEVRKQGPGAWPAGDWLLARVCRCLLRVGLFWPGAAVQRNQRLRAAQSGWMVHVAGWCCPPWPPALVLLTFYTCVTEPFDRMRPGVSVVSVRVCLCVYVQCDRS